MDYLKLINTFGKKIEKKVRKAIFDFQMFKNIKSILVAISGGKDSLILLLMLKKIIGRGFDKLDLFAVHVEKNFSNKKCIENICNKLNVKVFFLKSSLENAKCYSCARERRKLIFNKAKSLNIKTVAFGHHLDDNVETIFLNFFQKGDFEGILAKIKMVKFQTTIIRPLIYVTEKEIISFANKIGCFNNINKCSYENTSKRKEIKNIIKEIEKKFPYVKKNISKAILLHGSKKAQKI